MNVRQINLALQTTAVAMIAGAISAAVAGVVMPLEIARSTDALPIPTVAIDHSHTLPAVSSFSPIFARSLQSPLGGSATVAGATVDSAASQTAPVAQLVLVGTVGNTLALIKGPDGSIAMIEPGDDVDGSAVLAIRPSQVDLRINGKLTTLRMAPVPDDSSILQTK